MTRTFWRIRQFLMIVFGVFLLFFGIQLLIAAYRLANPYWFIMTFFASNLIILISGALLAGFIAQMVKMRKESSDVHQDSAR
jgi:protein-S-isoprenylcysteine O-methyltransferase Ste14